jgi:Mg/Co/Ni transporter MgtE
VRAYVAQRLTPARLFRFIRDPDLQVRKIVARRLPEESLGLLICDPEPEVRRLIAERMHGTDLTDLLNDSDWTVRLAAVANAPVELLQTRLEVEDDEEVQQAIREALGRSSEA